MAHEAVPGRVRLTSVQTEGVMPSYTSATQPKEWRAQHVVLPTIESQVPEKENIWGAGQCAGA